MILMYLFEEQKCNSCCFFWKHANNIGFVQRATIKIEQEDIMSDDTSCCRVFSKSKDFRTRHTKTAKSNSIESAASSFQLLGLEEPHQ